MNGVNCPFCYVACTFIVYLVAKVLLNTAYAKAASHSLNNIVKTHRTTHTNTH